MASRKKNAALTTPPTGIVRVELSKKRRAEILDELRFMPDDDFKTVATVAAYMEVLTLAAGVKLFDEGSASRHMSIIVEGEVKIQKTSFAEEIKILATLGRGKVIGEMSVIDGEPRSATAVASRGTTLLILQQSAYEHLVEERPDVAVRMLSRIAKTLSQRLRATSGQLIEKLE
jgi:CRP/FNR family transcriptional regulator, cyclic AMP receptor protein